MVDGIVIDTPRPKVVSLIKPNIRLLVTELPMLCGKIDQHICDTNIVYNSA